MMKKPLRHTPFEIPIHPETPAATHLTPTQLAHEMGRLKKDEAVAFIRAYVQERTPAAFESNPLLWEAVRRWLASRVNVHEREVGLSGSAQLGYSIVKTKNWAPFRRDGSDLDLFIVNQSLFAKVSTEARRFCSENEKDQTFSEQAKTVERMLAGSWVDVKHVPAVHDKYPTISILKNDASIVIDRLKLHDFSLKASSIRVYDGWGALSIWTKVSYAHLSASAS